MNFKNNVRLEVAYFTVARVLEILNERDVRPENAWLEAEIEHDFGTFGASEAPRTFLCFTEELDAPKVKARIDEHVATMGSWLGPVSSFVKFLNLASKVWTHTQRGIFMDKMKINHQVLATWMNGGFPGNLKDGYAALSASLS